MSSKKSCFVLGAIGLPGSKERKHADLVLNYIIKPPASSANYDVGRADKSSNSGMITVDVINALLDSDLVIADLSFLNPNVFYELGLRHSTRRPTIHLASHDTQLPFDNADHRAIFYDIGDWYSHEQAKQNLTQNIASLENGLVTNPVTIAQAHSNDARLSKIIDSVFMVLPKLEERIARIADTPEKGAITREHYKEVTEKHRDEILVIVKAIRQRIDARAIGGDSLPQAVDVMRRLSDIERIVMAQNGIHYSAVAVTPQ